MLYLRMKWLAVGHVIPTATDVLTSTPDRLFSCCSCQLAVGVAVPPAYSWQAVTCPWPPSPYVAHLCNFPILCLLIDSQEFILYSGHQLYALCKYLVCGLFLTLLYRKFEFYAAKFVSFFLMVCSFCLPATSLPER